MSTQPQTKEVLIFELYEGLCRHWHRWMRQFVYGGIVTMVACTLSASYFLLPMEGDLHAVKRLVEIPVGSTGRDVAKLLHEAEVVRDPQAFAMFARLLGFDSDLKAGYYLFSPGMTPLQILTHIQQGNVVTKRVTIPEGFNLEEIASLLARMGLADEGRFLRFARDKRLVYGDSCPIDMPVDTLEGYLFPDTYRFAKGQREEEIIKVMVNRFLEVATPLYEGYGGPMTFHEVVALASIVEKEAIYDRERPVIAGVFLNRLRIGMRLQADPTVRYVVSEPRSRVLYRDLEVESPYNTYRYPGLPPGPIASPGLASIRAVIKPADVDYMYFIARGDGTHYFSCTFAEHVAARRRFGY
ncbi:MAG: endolytic transglycosylase MltG [Firmicutes bacterium]|nr:endolytic transglycosylase MltG [Bacillota bacterium]